MGRHGEVDREHMSPRFYTEGEASHAGGRKLGWRQHVEVTSHVYTSSVDGCRCASTSLPLRVGAGHNVPIQLSRNDMP